MTQARSSTPNELHNPEEKLKKEVVMKSIFVWIFVTFLFLGAYGNGAVAAEKVTVMEWSHFIPAQDPGALLLAEHVKNMEKATNGRLKFNIHFAGTLTPPTQTFDSTVKGIVDVGSAGTGMTPGRFPLLEAMDLPWGTKFAIVSTAMVNDLVHHFKPKELNRVKVLHFDSQGPMLIHTNKPVRTLEELKGMKLRVPGGLSVSIIKTLGAIPLVISPGETYDALRKGLVDGVVCGMQGLDMFRFGEVTRYTTLNYRTGIGASGYVVMNLEKWNSLSADDQGVIERVFADYTEQLAELFDRMDADAKSHWEKQNGHQYIELSKEEEDRWAARLAPVYDQYIKDKSAKGVPASTVIEFCKDWVKKHVK
jgi:TRAP-type C4-dicarboxylate transport system substrate-binding protein